ALEGRALGRRGESCGGLHDVIRRQLETDAATAQFLRDHQRRAAAAERVEDHVTGVGRDADDTAKELFGHLAAVPAGALLERAADAAEVPGVFVRLKAVRQVLRAQD